MRVRVNLIINSNTLCKLLLFGNWNFLKVVSIYDTVHTVNNFLLSWNYLSTMFFLFFLKISFIHAPILRENNLTSTRICTCIKYF